MNNSCFISLFPQPHLKGWVKSELVWEKGKVMSMFPVGGGKKAYMKVSGWVLLQEREREGEFEMEIVGKGGRCRRWREEGLDQVGGPSAVRASRTPKRFWLWSKYGPSGPLPAPGHTNPRPSHISLLFSWLQNASGYQSRWGVFFL